MKKLLLKYRLLTALRLLSHGKIFKAIDQITTAIWMYYYEDCARGILKEIIEESKQKENE